MGKVESIYIAADSGDPVVPINEAYLEAGKGIVGDRYHAAASKALAEGGGTPDNQLTLIASEELDSFLERHDSDLDRGAFRRSVVTRGVDLNAMVGKQFKVGEAVCEGVELCEPCAWLARHVHEAVIPDLVHKAGIRAVITDSGKVRPGSSIQPL